MPKRARGQLWPWLLLVLLPLAAVAAAVVSQHVYGMLPCPWCVLQRLLFVLIALLALPGLLVRVPIVRLAAAVEVLLVCTAGLAAALWQHFVAASSTSCAMTLADRINTAVGLDALWPEVFAAYAAYSGPGRRSGPRPRNSSSNYRCDRRCCCRDWPRCASHCKKPDHSG